MKFLLDEMWSRVVAEQLRLRGYDAESVDERPTLRSLSDEELLKIALDEGRTLVTENARDFQRIANIWRHQGREHCGILYTQAGRFPRVGHRGIGRLMSALAAVAAGGSDPTNLEIWLE